MDRCVCRRVAGHRDLHLQPEHGAQPGTRPVDVGWLPRVRGSHGPTGHHLPGGNPVRSVRRHPMGVDWQFGEKHLATP